MNIHNLPIVSIVLFLLGLFYLLAAIFNWGNNHDPLVPYGFKQRWENNLFSFKWNKLWSLRYVSYVFGRTASRILGFIYGIAFIIFSLLIFLKLL